MFKSLFAFVDGDSAHPAEGSDVARLLKDIHKVAFFNELDAAVLRLHNKDVDTLLSEGRDKDVVAAIISSDGLNYGNLPKGLLTFHHAVDGTRTPVEEQLMEGAQSARQADGTVNMHLTVSGSHREAFAGKLAEVKPRIEKEMGVKINVGMSEQKASTDTVAVNEDNTLFRDNGNLVFRPGGHGALIQNLNDIDAEVVFIKNIDNVVPDSLRGATLKYKMVIAYYMMELHDAVARYIKLIDSREYTDAQLQEICAFLRDKFSFTRLNFPPYKGKTSRLICAPSLTAPCVCAAWLKTKGNLAEALI